MNAHYDTLLTEDVSQWDHLLSNQLILAMEYLATKTGEELGNWNAEIYPLTTDGFYAATAAHIVNVPIIRGQVT